jgi:peptide/nickel transport system substrate-binding protein
MIEDSYWLRNASGGETAELINPRESELLQQALATSDEAEREAIYREIALEMIKDRIIVPVVSPKLVLAYRSNVEGVRYSACCNLPLAELSRE